MSREIFTIDALANSGLDYPLLAPEEPKFARALRAFLSCGSIFDA